MTEISCNGFSVCLQFENIVILYVLFISVMVNSHVFSYFGNTLTAGYGKTVLHN